MDYKEFYSNLGKLLYAIAKADGAVQDEEVNEFYKVLKEDIIPFENRTDEFGTDMGFYTEFEFESMLDKKLGVNQAYEDFISFVKQHKTVFKNKHKEICIQSVSKIADAYEGIEKSEQYFIEKLKKDFDKL